MSRVDVQFLLYWLSIELWFSFLIFVEADIDGTTFLGLTRDDLLEIIPGVENFKVRKSMFNYIQEITSAPSSSKDSLLEPINKTPTPVEKQKPVSVQDVGSPLVSCLQLNFPIYTEPGITDVTTNEVKNKIIRNTISSMRSITHISQKREPSVTELETMAIALVNRYPSMKDCSKLNPAKPHEGLLLLLKRRLANVKPVKKRQGPCPSKGKKKLKFSEGEKEVENEEVVSLSETPAPPTEDNQDTALRKEEEDMAKHYNQLNIKMKEKKPNPKIISQLLTLERKSRRNFIESLSQIKPAQKVDSILKAYPCFTNPIHLLEEMQRELDEEAPFLAECSQRMSSYWEQLYLYGIMNHLMPLPEKFCSSDEKAGAVLLNLSNIFPGMKKNVPLAIEIGDDEDINITVNKLNRPYIIMTKSGLFVTMYQRIFSKLDRNSYTRAILVYISLFYTFRMEYIPGQENSMLFLQKYILLDNVHEKDSGKFVKCVKKFIDFVGKK